MFGPFGAGDSLRVYRLQRKGVSLDLHRALTRPTTPLWEAWLAFLTQQAMGQPTFVLADLQDGEGFIQVRYRPHQAAADVVFLAPALAESRQAAGIWPRLLEGAGVETAGRGIQRIFASLPEAGAELDLFNQSGFTPYAKEDIHRLVQVQPGPLGGGLPTIRPQRPEDWPAIQKLCVAIIPQRVRQTEGGIAAATGCERGCQRYLLPRQDDGDLVAALDIHVGVEAHWLRLLVHPDGRDLVGSLVGWGLNVLREKATPRPVYCNVRQYESGVQPGLSDAGFELYATRTLLVKHTVALLKSPIQDLVPALQSGAEPVPPAFHINGEPEFQTSNGRLAAKREA